MISNQVKQKKNINIGIELLRSALCLWIVIHHTANYKKEHKKYLQKKFHVPTFFVLSFYFYYPTVSRRIIKKVKSRFERLLYPYIFWPIMTLIINNILIKYTSLVKSRAKITIKDFFIQLLFGTKYCKIFWFQFNLIFISFCLTIFSLIFKESLLIILQYLGIISLYINLLGINFNFFISYNLLIRISLGTLIEIIPLAVIGCIFSSLNLLSKIKKLKLYTQLILFFMIYLMFQYDLFIFYKGFMYSNILLYIFSSTILLLSFGSLNFNNLNKLTDLIKVATQFTGGIYYIHPNFIKYVLFFTKIRRTYFIAFIIYYTCYIICFIGNKAFSKSKFIYLFN